MELNSIIFPTLKSSYTENDFDNIVWVPKLRDQIYIWDDNIKMELNTNNTIE